MRNWKNWLIPILTGLTVAALALLPLRLSVLRDGELTGTVHTEALGADSSFPAQSPPLPRRLELLAQYQDLPESLTIIGRELEGEALEEAVEQVRGELDALAEAGVLPEGLLSSDAVLSGSQLYLRDQTDLASAGFVHLGGYDKSSWEYRSLVIDRETGFLTALELNGIQSMKDAPVHAAALGAALLDRMGVEHRLLESFDGAALFRLSEVPATCFVTARPGNLYVRLQTDLELSDSDENMSVAYGLVR